jgi:hypothetical protein
LIELLLKVSEVAAAEDGLLELDLNPVVTVPGGALPLDARVTLVR